MPKNAHDSTTKKYAAKHKGSRPKSAGGGLLGKAVKGMAARHAEASKY